MWACIWQAWNTILCPRLTVPKWVLTVTEQGTIPTRTVHYLWGKMTSTSLSAVSYVIDMDLAFISVIVIQRKTCTQWLRHQHWVIVVVNNVSFVIIQGWYCCDCSGINENVLQKKRYFNALCEFFNMFCIMWLPDTLN